MTNNTPIADEPYESRLATAYAIALANNPDNSVHENMVIACKALEEARTLPSEQGGASFGTVSFHPESDVGIARALAGLPLILPLKQGGEVNGQPVECAENPIDKIAESVRFGLINAEPFSIDEVIRVAVLHHQGELPIEPKRESDNHLTTLQAENERLRGGLKMARDYIGKQKSDVHKVGWGEGVAIICMIDDALNPPTPPTTQAGDNK